MDGVPLALDHHRDFHIGKKPSYRYEIDSVVFGVTHWLNLPAVLFKKVGDQVFKLLPGQVYEVERLTGEGFSDLLPVIQQEDCWCR